MTEEQTEEGLHRTSVALPTDLVDEIDRFREQLQKSHDEFRDSGVSRAAAIRVILRRYLDAEKKNAQAVARV